MDFDAARLLVDLMSVDALVSEGGRILHCNGPFTDHLQTGLGWEECQERHVWDIGGPASAELLKDWFEGWLASGEEHGQIQLPGTGGDEGLSGSSINVYRMGNLELVMAVGPALVPGLEPAMGFQLQLGMFQKYLRGGELGLTIIGPINEEVPSFLFITREGAELIDAKVDDVQGSTIDGIFDEEDVERLLSICRKGAMGTQAPATCDLKIITAEGETVYLEAVVGTTVWKGKPALFIFFRDVTDRTLMFEELRRFSEAFQLVTDTVILADGNLNVLYMNPAGLERSGYTLDEVIGRPVEMFAASLEGEADPQEIIKTMFKEGYWRGERWAMSKHGNLYPVDIISTIQMDDAGRPQFLTIVSRDMSAHKSNVRSMLRARERAEFFTDLLSHDINNYIQGVLGRLELLTRVETDPSKRDHIEKAIEQASRTSDLIAKVRALSQAQHPEELERVDLQRVIDEALEDLRRKYKESPFEAEVRPAEGEVVVMADELLKDLVINILDNAVKHTETPPARIEVSVVPHEEMRRSFWRFIVADHGPGIPDEDKHDVFYKFVRKEGGPEGSGLGLSLVMALCDRYKGRVWIDDRVPGQASEGARVIVELPRA